MPFLSNFHSPIISPVELARRREQHRPRRHVQAHGEGLGGEQDLDQAALEEQFHHLFEDGQDAGVVSGETAHAQRLHL